MPNPTPRRDRRTKLSLLIMWTLVVALHLIPLLVYLTGSTITLEDISIALLIDGLALPFLLLLTFGPQILRHRLRHWHAYHDESSQVFSLSAPNYQILGGMLAILGITPLTLLLWGALFEPESITGELIVVLLLLSAMLAGAGIALIYRHSGHLILTDEAIILRRLGRKRRMRYQDVVRLEEGDHDDPPNLVIEGAGQKLQISTRAGNFEKLYNALRRRVGTLPSETSPAFPWRLGLTRQFYLKTGAGALAVLSFMGLLTFLAVRTSPNPGPAAAAIMGIISLIVLVSVVMTLNPQQPCKLTFDRDALTACYFLKGCRRWPARDIQAIQADVRQRPRVADRPIVQVTFAAGPPLVLDANRALELGCYLGRYHKTLRFLYASQLAHVRQHPEEKLTHLLAIVREGDLQAIERARDLVTPRDMPWLTQGYWTLDTWTQKIHWLHLFVDHLAPGSRNVMRDFLRATTDAADTAALTSAQAIALCQLEGSFDRYPRYLDDRQLLQKTARRYLAEGN